MKSTSPEVREIWSLIRELSVSQKQTDKGIKELRASQKQTDEQIKRTDKSIKELRAGQKQTDEQIKKFSAELSASQKQTDRGIKELRASQKQTDEQMKQTDIKLNQFIGDTGNRWGKLGENLVKGNLAQRLKEKGIQVEGAITNVKKGGIEFDIVAVNGKETVVVEVKATLDPADVDKFKKNIERFTILWPEFKEKTTYGAMAFLLKSNRKAESLAEKEGFFVISATGDVIIKNEEAFKPKSFN